MPRFTSKSMTAGVGWLHGARVGQRIYIEGEIWVFLEVGSTTSWIAETKKGILEYAHLVFNRFKRRKLWTIDFTSGSKKKPEYVTLSHL